MEFELDDGSDSLPEHIIDLMYSAVLTIDTLLERTLPKGIASDLQSLRTHLWETVEPYLEDHWVH